MKSILITDHTHDILPEGLRAAGFEVIYEPEISTGQIFDEIGRFQGVVINTRVRMGKAILSKADNLEFIARLGSGLDIIDLAEAGKRNVTVISSPEGNANAVAEHATGMLLALLNKINLASLQVREKQWLREQNRGMELRGRKVGIYGFGNTGSAFATKLVGFGVDLVAYDQYKTGYTNGFPFVREVSQNDVIDSDVISFHLPLTEETEYLIDKSLLSRFRRGAILINTSRGKILKTDDLLTALDEGTISGACLDVLENENLESLTQQEEIVFNKLLMRDNVLVTPHVAGWTYESKRRIAEVLLFKIRKHYHI